MLNTKDINYKIRKNLQTNEFLSSNIERQKEIIDEELKKYTTSKINELKANILSENNLNKEIDMSQLLEILKELIPTEEQHEVLRHFTHFITMLASDMQGYEIIWWVDNNTDLIENPICEFNEEGYWDSIRTHQNTDLIKTFNFTYDVFKNNFMKKQKTNQK